MQSEVIFAGFGGQGILLMGKILAQVAMEEGFEVAWVPSYGPEMRGGTANCTVVIGDKPIASPIIKKPSHLVAMNGPSLNRYAETVKPNGLILINSSMISQECDRDDVDKLKVSVTTIARDIGAVRIGNIVALAAFVSRSRIVSFDLLQATVKAEFAKKKELIPMNMRALEAGRRVALEGAYQSGVS
jgi:2-oxoglutarate ferredoxin oxidoreductase subunit gamma